MATICFGAAIVAVALILPSISQDLQAQALRDEFDGSPLSAVDELRLSTPPAEPQIAADTEKNERLFLVILQSHATEQDAKEIANKHGYHYGGSLDIPLLRTRVHYFHLATHVLDSRAPVVQSSSELAKLMTALLADPRVRYVQPNYHFDLHARSFQLQ